MKMKIARTCLTAEQFKEFSETLSEMVKITVNGEELCSYSHFISWQRKHLSHVSEMAENKRD